ncbi:PQQ-dependent sugar dehydrogenase [Halomonas campisalis]|uniref:PQQ-dependent sugar dehydrogenase n=1 Tax=Billgrantia campisalis TaxID=74661 RepID=A0ABS9P824_9GAMM|nr:PQQ-dependent sugar dehydrogenase [Halomonas campisalis]MCG6657761.1 PQQ-dependent sugar dehydrogenase [Halomonas campisalis]MDR5862467.1 PQQ-dependent sugar dehydrogenase [Halomonas campisalis]
MHTTRKLLPTTLLLGTALVVGSAQAAEVVYERIATEHLDLRLERLATGLAHPWAVAQLPDGRFLVSERPGRLTLIDEAGDVRHLEGVPEVNARGQGGLLDVVLHPDYGTGDGEHDWIYFTWSKADGGGTATALSRGRLGDGALEEVEELFVQDRFSGPGRHYGSRLAWLPDGTLLMSIGDRGSEPPRAQDKGDHAGSVLRLTETGGVPDDNPFLDEPEVLDELFTAGNRNIQGMIVNRHGEAWATEHGPRGGDELNHLQAGENYGWPEVSLGRDYATGEPIGADSLPGMRDPVHVFDGTLAPSGLTEVTADAFPDWQGDLLAGGLRSERLMRLTLAEGELADHEVILDGHIGRVRDVRQGHDGALYLLNDDAPGSLYRLVPAD